METDSASDASVDVVRRAYEAYAGGDVAGMLDLVDPDLEWTFLDPSVENPEPQVCFGRHELDHALRRRESRGLRTELQEVVASDGDRVMVVTRTPGLEAYRVDRRTDLNFDVVTVRDGRIVALRACRDRDEALALLRG
ncbi:MAG TPA: nuclear transport factor 2 family protein [Actinomycetota bacterium]